MQADANLKQTENMIDEARQHDRFLTEHQPQQPGHEILVLGFTETMSKAQHILTESRVQIYDG